jgi:hypothetical protein
MEFLDDFEVKLKSYFEAREKSIFPAEALDAGSNVVLTGKALSDEHGVFWPSEQAASKIAKSRVAFVKFQNRAAVAVSEFEACPTELGIHYHFRTLPTGV